MLLHMEWAHGEFAVFAHANRGPLLGFTVALVLALAARFTRAVWLGRAAGGAGILAGWYAISGEPWVLLPRQPLDRLPLFALATLLIGLAAIRFRLLRERAASLFLMAVVAAWWLPGGPYQPAEFWHIWPFALAAGLCVPLFSWVLAGQASPMRGVLAGLTLAVSLHVAQAPPFWTLFVLTPAFASLGLLVLPRLSADEALPLAADLGAIASVVIIVAGRLPRHVIGPFDVAALSPLLALLLVSNLVQRLRFTAHLAPLLGYIAAGALGVGATWVALLLLPL
jgi:hypothetical protein